MAEKLTETIIRRTSVPRSGQVMLWDSVVTGLAVRIMAGGSRKFWFQYRNRLGKNQMVKVGNCRNVKLADARKAAHKLAGQIADGKDPAAERAEAKRRDSSALRALFAVDGEYARHLKHRRVVNAKQALSSLNRGLHRLLSREVAQLTRRDFVGAIAAIEADGRPGAADDLRKFTRVFLEWCVERGFLTANPLAGLRRPKRSRAERLKAGTNGGRALSDDELRKVWQAAGQFESFGGLVRLGLLTALRRGELAQIGRRDLHADRIVVQPEHAKTGTRHEVPLTALMREVIAGAPITSSSLLFPSSKTGGRLKGWTKLVAKLQRASGVEFTLHDLRRTCRTLMSRLGVGEDIAELAIGHVRADLIARYNKDQAWEGRSDAFAKVSEHVAALIGARAGAEVIALKT